MHKKKDKQPLVSVIIPAYNEEKYISKCLKSLSAQSIKNFEVIVVDDGSTDSTKEIVSKFAVKLISLTHGGPGRARNKGAKIARGKVLVFLDADMFVSKNYLKNIIKPIIEGKCVGTYTKVEYVANRENIWAQCWNINLDLPLNKRIRLSDKTIGLVFRAIRRNIFLSTTGFDSTWGYIDDRSLSRAGLYAMPVYDAICYHYNPDSIKDVFFSARWIGRSAELRPTLQNFKRYSIFNSIHISLRKISRGAPLVFFLFKIVFDLGILTGLIFRNSDHNFAK